MSTETNSSSSKVVPIVFALFFAAIGIAVLFFAHAATPKSGSAAVAGSSTSSSGDALDRKAAYSIGYLMANGNKHQIPDLDVNAFTDGFKQAYSGAPSKYSDAEMRQALTEYKAETEKKLQARAKAAGAQNQQDGDKFLAGNAKKAGVKTTASGLQYEVLKEGTGASPKATDVVQVNYEGKLLSGKVFDTSYGKAPVSFPLNQVIPGWTEGVQLMKEGAKYRFTIPSKLAYGETGAGDAIPPNSTLVFEVELLKVNPPKDAAAK